MSYHYFTTTIQRLSGVMRPTLSSLPRISVLIACLAPWAEGFAADHFDAPRFKNLGQIATRDADISDLNVFPIASDQGVRLVLMMNVRPFSPLFADFDPDIEYSFRIRRAAVEGSGTETRIVTGDQEFRFACTIEEGWGLRRKDDSIRCTTRKYAAPDDTEGTELLPPIEGNLESTIGSTSDPIRLFAGLRADSFMTHGNSARYCTRDYDPSEPLKNFTAKSDVLAIVAELDVSKAFGEIDPDMPHLAVVAQTRDLEDGAILDHAGRGEVSVFMIREPQRRGAWNSEDVFAMEGDYSADIQSGLRALDMLDGKADWPQPHPLLGILQQDYMLVDVRYTTQPDEDARSYLAIEMAAFKGTEPRYPWGGRTPNQDQMDHGVTLFVEGPEAETDLDGDIEKPPTPATAEFPYLGEPHEHYLTPLLVQAFLDWGFSYQGPNPCGGP